tara:strand:+ start:161 stop:334 length:174 start_codon:yes stop_codon:yes gene_type:complete
MRISIYESKIPGQGHGLLGSVPHCVIGRYAGYVHEEAETIEQNIIVLLQRNGQGESE